MDATVVKPPPSEATSKVTVFGLLWLGQMISVIGSTLTRFAFGVYVYQETGSATQFALVSFFALLPAVVVLPFAGALVDRWDRRWVMIISDTLAGLSTLTAWVLLNANLLEAWHIYVLVAFNAACGAFQGPAFNASIPLLVPKQHLGRANGLVRMGPAIARVVVPAFAGLLMVMIGIQGVILIDLTTFLFAFVTVLLVRIPRPNLTEIGQKVRKSFFREAGYGWSYIRTNPGLYGLLLFLAFTNLTLGMVWLLIIPLVLSFTDEAQLGTILSLAGSGMLLGGLAMSIWGGPKKRVLGVLGFTFIQGFVLLLGGLQPSAPLVVIAAFIFLFSFQIVMGTERTLWQTKVPMDMQGRVHAIHEMLALSATGLAFLLSGPLTDNVFEPLMAPNGALAGSVGQIIGTGDGRGIGLLFIVLGGLTTIATLMATLNPRIRQVEQEVPDALEDDAPPVGSPNAAPSPVKPRPSFGRRLRTWLVRGGIGLLVLLLIAAGVATWMVMRPWAQTSGTLAVAGLTDTVRVVRDDFGVPHIYAQNERDLLFTQGYVHAQERLWQMEYYRRLGSGTLSELIGARILPTDRFLRTFGLRRHAERALAEVDAETLTMLQDYCDGVNAYIESHRNNLPLEYTLMQAPQPALWTPVDVLTWGNVLSLQLAGNYRLELLRAQLYAQIGEEATQQLMPPRAENTPLIIPDGESIEAAFANTNFDHLYELDELAGDPSLPWGSNNWVVHGSRTESGTPMLANDPHLQLGSPATWYMVGLHGGRFDVVGFSFPGSPFVVVGHNADIAWGITNVGPDVQDLYLQRLDDEFEPTQYEWNGEWRDLEIIQEVIQIKDSEPHTITIRSTHQGPLITDILSASVIANDQRTPKVALRWSLFEVGSVVASLKELNLAGDWESFRGALSGWDIPGQNFVYADVQGNIGYQLTGQVPIRPEGHQGLLPMPGWTDEFEWEGYIPFEELPMTYNPPEGFIATANNKVTADDYPYMISYDWWPGYRAQRITERLAGDDSITMAEMAALQQDTFSIPAAAIRPYLAAITPENDQQAAAIAYLNEWDGTMAADSVAAAIYQSWYSALVKNTIQDDLGEEITNRFLAGNYHRFGNSHIPMMVEMVQEPTDVWFDDKITPDTEDFEDMARRSLNDALTSLTEGYGSDMATWTWGRLHTVTLTHAPLGASGIPPVERIANGAPIALGGDNTTVNNAAFRWNAPFKVWYGTSMRYLVDVGAFDDAQVVLTTGQSGHLLNPHYQDMTPLWRDGAYLPLPFTEEGVNANATNELILTPP
jgi:penicillin amidase